MQRTTTILGLLQVLLVVVGFFALGIVLKVNGWPDAVEVHWNPWAVFLRKHGFVLLLLPFAWTLFATVAQRIDRGMMSYGGACIVGVGIAIGIILTFMYAAVFPCTHPMYIFFGK